MNPFIIDDLSLLTSADWKFPPLRRSFQSLRSDEVSETKTGFINLYTPMVKLFMLEICKQ